MKILTGLKKRVEDISETVYTEIRNSIVETKGSLNKIRNMLDRINSRLKKAEELINDRKEEVMESNQAE